MWRPIEEAPKDHNAEMLDLWAREKRYTDCWWGYPTYGPNKKEPGWVHQGGYDCDGPVAERIINPTHFMPLPPPPETSE